MGVIHKLKSEVVDFIVKTKHAEPGVSCRSLAGIVSKNFNIRVSKSSINAVLKEARLSSPVGRRPTAGHKPKKFRIPEERKRQILPSRREAIPEGAKRSGASPAQADPKTVSAKRQGRPSPAVKRGHPSPEKAIVPQEISQDKGSALHLLPSRQEAQRIFPEDGMVWDGLGAIFLKAAEWEISDTPVFGKLLKEYMKGGGLTDTDLAGQIMVFMRAFGLQNATDLSRYDKQGLWALLGIKQAVDARALDNIASSVEDKAGLQMNFSIEMAQVFTQVSFVKLLLEDGEGVWIDAQTSGVWPQQSKIPLSSPVNKVMADIAKQLLSNREPLIFCSAGAAGPLSPEFGSLVAAFNNREGKRIEKIFVYDMEGGELAQFDVVAKRKRVFLAGIWPGHDLFQESLVLRSAASFSVKTGWMGKEWSCREVALPGRQPGAPELRVVLISESGNGAPFLGVLTNGQNHDISAPQMALTYLWRWPALREGFNLAVVNNRAQMQAAYEQNSGNQGGDDSQSHIIERVMSGEMDVPGLAEAYFGMLSAYCQRHYFPARHASKDIKSLISDIYGINGKMSYGDQMICVQLMLKENGISREDVEFAIRRINERSIHDYLGRQLFLKL